MQRIIGQRKDQHACSRRFASAADLEPDRGGFAAVSEDHLNLVTGKKLAPESDILDAHQHSAHAPFSVRAGGQHESQMRDTRKDRLAIEVAVKAAALLRDPEMERAWRRCRRRGDGLEAGLRKEYQRADYMLATRRSP